MTRPSHSEGRQNHRREVIAAELRNALQELIARGLSDPRVQGIITITGVDVDAELARAVVRISVLPEKNQNKCVAGLRHAAKHLRHQIGEKIQTIRIPDLAFELDLGMKKQAAVIDALAKVAAERETREAKEGVDPQGRGANNAGTGPEQSGTQELPSA